MVSHKDHLSSGLHLMGRPHWSFGLNPGVRGVGGGGSGPATLVAWPQPRCEGSGGWGQWAGHTGHLASTPV